jgi:hypothetical protein
MHLDLRERSAYQLSGLAMVGTDIEGGADLGRRVVAQIIDPRDAERHSPSLSV